MSYKYVVEMTSSRCKADSSISVEPQGNDRNGNIARTITETGSRQDTETLNVNT